MVPIGWHAKPQVTSSGVLPIRGRSMHRAQERTPVYLKIGGAGTRLRPVVFIGVAGQRISRTGHSTADWPSIHPIAPIGIFC